MSDEQWKTTSFYRVLEATEREDERIRQLHAGRRSSHLSESTAVTVTINAPPPDAGVYVDERVRRKIKRIHGVDFGLSTFSAASQALSSEHKAIIDAMARGDSDSAIARSLRMTVPRMRELKDRAIVMLAHHMKQ